MLSRGLAVKSFMKARLLSLLLLVLTPSATSDATTLASGVPVVKKLSDEVAPTGVKAADPLLQQQSSDLAHVAAI